MSFSVLSSRLAIFTHASVFCWPYYLWANRGNIFKKILSSIFRPRALRLKNIRSKKTACYITVKIENTDFFFCYEFSIGNSMQDQEPTEPENVHPQNIQALHSSNASLIINFSCIPVLSWVPSVISNRLILSLGLRLSWRQKQEDLFNK